MVLRKAFAGVLAVGLAASGLTWQACLAKPAAPSTRPAAAAVHDHHHMAHGTHKHQIDVSSAPATDKQPVDDHGCMKCCSLCVVSGVAPSAANVGTILLASFIEFALEQDQYAGQTILVDPGIPKRIG